jgi:hypothetical protein
VNRPLYRRSAGTFVRSSMTATQSRITSKPRVLTPSGMAKDVERGLETLVVHGDQAVGQPAALSHPPSCASPLCGRLEPHRRLFRGRWARQFLVDDPPLVRDLIELVLDVTDQPLHDQLAEVRRVHGLTRSAWDDGDAVRGMIDGDKENLAGARLHDPLEQVCLRLVSNAMRSRVYERVRFDDVTRE